MRLFPPQTTGSRPYGGVGAGQRPKGLHSHYRVVAANVPRNWETLVCGCPTASREDPLKAPWRLYPVAGPFQVTRNAAEIRFYGPWSTPTIHNRTDWACAGAPRDLSARRRDVADHRVLLQGHRPRQLLLTQLAR